MRDAVRLIGPSAGGPSSARLHEDDYEKEDYEKDDYEKEDYEKEDHEKEDHEKEDRENDHENDDPEGDVGLLGPPLAPRPRTARVLSGKAARWVTARWRGVRAVWTTPALRHRALQILLVMTTLFVAEASRGLVVPTLSPTIRALGGTASEVALAVSLFSLGRLAATPPFGYWADHRTAREVLLAALAIATVGNVGYAWAASVTDGGHTSVILVCVARFVVGAGSSVLSVCRSFVAERSTVADRTRYFALLGLVQFIGFSLMPGIGGLIAYPAVAGGVLAGMNVVMAIALAIWLESINSSPAGGALNGSNPNDNKTTTTTMTTPEEGGGNGLQLQTLVAETAPSEDDEEAGHSDAPPRSLLPPDAATVAAPSDGAISIRERRRQRAVFALFVFLNFVLRGVLATAETLGPAAQQFLNAADDDTIADSGLYFMALGLVGCVVFLAIDPLIRAGCKEYLLLCGGILAGAVGSIFLIEDVYGSSMAVFTIGSTLVWSFANPICSVLTVSAFSKLMGTKPQAVEMSWLTTAGSVARIVFPLFGTYVSSVAIGVTNIALCLVCLVCVIVFQRFWV